MVSVEPHRLTASLLERALGLRLGLGDGAPLAEASAIFEEGSGDASVVVAAWVDEAQASWDAWSHVYLRVLREHEALAPMLGGGAAPSERLVWARFDVHGFESLVRVRRRLLWLDPELVAKVVHDAALALAALADEGLAHDGVGLATLFLRASADGLVVRMAPPLPHDARAPEPSPVRSLCLLAAHAISGDDLPWQPLEGAAAEPPPLLRLAPWTPPGLAVVLDGVLRAGPGDPEPSLRELAHALTEVFPRLASAKDRSFEVRSVPPRERAAVPEALPLVRSWDDVERYLESKRGASSAAPPSPLASSGVFAPGDVLAGKYRLVRLLGRGGMGEVYEARRLEDDRPVALKWMRGAFPDQKGDLYRRFLREGRVGLTLSHPHVVRVLDVSSDGACPFLVMELLRGVDLAQLLEAEGPLEPHAVAQLFVQACEGLEAVHRAGLVHRDIKPSNLLLDEKEDGSLVVKVADFGIIKRVHQAEGEATSLEGTQTDGILGSPLYMSPEQIRTPRAVDGRSDVFSLGTSLYRALAGAVPWRETSAPAVFVRICNDEPVPLEIAAPWVHRGLAAVVRRAMAKSPEERFASARHFADALRPFAGRGPLTRERLLEGAASRRAQRTEAKTQDSVLLEGGLGGSGSPTKGATARRRSRTAKVGLGAVTLVASVLGLRAAATDAPERPERASVVPEPSTPPVDIAAQAGVIQAGATQVRAGPGVAAPGSAAPSPSAELSRSARREPPREPAPRPTSASTAKPSASPAGSGSARAIEAAPAPAPSVPALRQVW